MMCGRVWDVVRATFIPGMRAVSVSDGTHTIVSGAMPETGLERSYILLGLSVGRIDYCGLRLIQ